MLFSMAAARDDNENESRRRLRLVHPAEPDYFCTMENHVCSGDSKPGTDDPAGDNLSWHSAGAGDPETFQAVFLRYGKPVAAFILHMIGDRLRAEELAQETFFRAYRGRDRVRQGSRISTWIFGIARNVALEAIRDRSRRRRTIGLEDLGTQTVQDQKADPSENFMAEELRRAIRRSLAELTEDQRLVFVLKLLQKMRYEEISLITGSSIGKLKTDLHRARQQLRERLRSYLAGRMPGI